MKPIALRVDRLETRLAPAVATWDGGGADNHWTTAANWVGDVAANPGDDLVFPASAAQKANVNHFPVGTSFGHLYIDGFNYQISGNGIALTNGLSVTTGAASVSDLSPTLALSLDLHGRLQSASSTEPPSTLTTGDLTLSDPATFAVGLHANGSDKVSVV